MANSIIHFLRFGLFFLFIRARSGFALANSGFAFEGTTVFRCGIATEGITVFRCSIATEGITVVRCSIATGGITVFRCGVATGGLPFRCGIATGGLPSFEAGCFRVLQGRLRIAGSLSRGLPSSGAVSLPGGLPSFKQDASVNWKEEAWLSQVDVERGMLRYVLAIVGPAELGIRGQLLAKAFEP